MKKRLGIVALALLGVVLLACKKGEGSDCHFSKDCKDNLVCLSSEIGPSKCIDYEQAKAECARRDLCKKLGMCTASSVTGELVVCAK